MPNEAVRYLSMLEAVSTHATYVARQHVEAELQLMYKVQLQK